MKKLFLRSVAVTLLLSILFCSCVSTTTIQSNPPGADVYIDGYYVGKTPYLYADSKVVGSATLVDIRKEGYEPVRTMMVRNEDLDVGALVGGVFTFIPFFWILKYRPVHEYDLYPYEESYIIQEGSVIEQGDFYGKSAKLKELKELLDNNVITQEEFEKEKTKVLDSE